MKNDPPNMSASVNTKTGAGPWHPDMMQMHIKTVRNFDSHRLAAELECDLDLGIVQSSLPTRRPW